MIKEIIEYECEICGDKYSTKEDAEDCESKGLPELYPIGMIFSLGYENMLFAVIKQNVKAYGHHHSYLTHACRDTNIGDNIFGQYCGFDSWHKISEPDTSLPCYQRIYKVLKDNNIKSINYSPKSGGAK